jgi:hypothetical protein
VPVGDARFLPPQGRASLRHRIVTGPGTGIMVVAST